MLFLNFGEASKDGAVYRILYAEGKHLAMGVHIFRILYQGVPSYTQGFMSNAPGDLLPLSENTLASGGERRLLALIFEKGLAPGFAEAR